MRGQGSVFRRGRVWWIQFCHAGSVHRESARTSSKTDAVRALRGKLEALASGRAVPDSRQTVGDAIASYVEHLTMRRGDGAASSAKTKLREPLEALGCVRLAELSAELIDRYLARRLREVGPATVNRETAYLRAALRLAGKRGKLARVPGFTRLTEPPPRQGVWSSRDDFERFAAHLPDDGLRALAFAAYFLGWRRQELYGLRWEWVDLTAEPFPEIRLPRTKNAEPRTVPLVGELRELFEHRREARKLEREDGTVELAEYVFHRGDGKPIRSPHRAWDRALREAGLSRRTLHDFRRTAARNLVGAGVPEHIAMQITGHKTPSIFRRYAIVDQADKAEALRKALAHGQAVDADSNVRPMRRKQAARTSTVLTQPPKES